MATQYTVGSTFVPIAEKQGIVYNGSPVDVEIASANNATEGQGIVLRSGASQSFAGNILARSKDVNDAATLNVVDFSVTSGSGGTSTTTGGDGADAKIFRQPKTAYAVGDVVFLNGANAKYCLVCKTAGTTDSGSLTFPSGAKTGDTLADGTATWEIRATATLVTYDASSAGVVTIKQTDGTEVMMQPVYQGAPSHNAIYRGKDITVDFDSGKFSANIANGTFDDIFIGDYIEKPFTSPVDGTTFNVKWRVAHLDYYLNAGGQYTHHVVIVPDRSLDNNVRMNPTDTTDGGYVGSEYFKTMTPKYDAAIQAAFGANHVLKYYEVLTNSINNTAPSMVGTGTTGSANHIDSYAVLSCLMSIEQLTGCSTRSSFLDTGLGFRQFSLFALDASSIYCRYRGNTTNIAGYRMRNIIDSKHFVIIYGRGDIGSLLASKGTYVRPYFLLT